jgi:hypothetical protein
VATDRPSELGEVVAVFLGGGAGEAGAADAEVAFDQGSVGRRRWARRDSEGEARGLWPFGVM